MSDDFFGDLGKSITRATQKAAMRTGSLIESTKINALITAETKSIEKLYLELGELVYESYGEGTLDPDSPMKAIIDELDTHIEKISSYRAELAELKGMKVCPSCGEIINKDALFCPNCGVSTVTGEAPEEDEKKPGTEADEEEPEDEEELEEEELEEEEEIDDEEEFEDDEDLEDEGDLEDEEEPGDEDDLEEEPDDDSDDEDEADEDYESDEDDEADEDNESDEDDEADEDNESDEDDEADEDDEEDESDEDDEADVDDDDDIEDDDDEAAVEEKQ